MANKKIILGLLVILSLFIFACAEQQEDLLPSDFDVDESEYMSDYEAEEEYSDQEYEEVETEDVEEYEEETYDEEYEAEETDDEINGEEMVEGITREEIAENDNEDSCWVGYYGYVYDLTYWLNEHPGGADEILPHCGTVEEFTEAYDDRHGQKDTLNRNDAIAELI